MRSREEALELTLKQIDRMEWEPAKAEEPDIGTELVLYLMEKNAALVDAITSIRAHVALQPSPLAKAIVATCDSALAIAGDTRSDETNEDLVQPEG